MNTLVDAAMQRQHCQLHTASSAIMYRHLLTWLLIAQVMIQVCWAQEHCPASQQLRQLPTLTHLDVHFLLNLPQLKHADAANNKQHHDWIVSRMRLLLQPKTA